MQEMWVCRFNSWVKKTPWRKKWQPTPVLLPEKAHGQRSLVDYSPWGHKRVRHNLATKQQDKRVYRLKLPLPLLLLGVTFIFLQWISPFLFRFVTLSVICYRFVSTFPCKKDFKLANLLYWS